MSINKSKLVIGKGRKNSKVVDAGKINNNSKIKVFIFFIVLFIVMTLVIGLTFEHFAVKKSKQEIALKEKNLEKVVLKLKWLHQAQFAGNYVAKEKGFYSDNGLDVNIVPFSFEEPTIQAVVDGKADFGITGADELILARAKGIPIKAIAVVYKHSPVCAYALKSSGITKPQDFIGKRVGIERGVNVEYLYIAMMQKLNINRSKIKELTIGYDATELLNETTDVSTGYIINEPNQVQLVGKEVNTILIADYGVDMYADVIFTTEETIKNKPLVVEKFLSATLKGWQYAIENQEEAVDLTLKYVVDQKKGYNNNNNNNNNNKHQTYMLAQSTPLINTGDSPIGWMEKSRWINAQEILLKQKLLDKPIDIDQAFTVEFLNKIQQYKKI